jgi:hypothetical protein
LIIQFQCVCEVITMAPMLLRRLPLLRFMSSRNFFTPSSFRLLSYPHSSSSLPLSTLSKPRYIIPPLFNNSYFLIKGSLFFIQKCLFFLVYCCWGYSFFITEFMTETKRACLFVFVDECFCLFVFFSQEEVFS